MVAIDTVNHQFMRARATRVREHLACQRILPPLLVRAERSEAIASVLLQASSFLPMSVVSLVADAGLLVFAIDDLFDDSDIGASETALRVEQWSSVARGEACPEVAFDPIAGAIRQIRHRLLSTAEGAHVIGEWAGAMERMLAAMNEERSASDQHRATGAMPTIAQYLQNGSYSVGIEMVVATAFIAMGAASFRNHWHRLRLAERSFSTAIRIANDLRTYDRECAEHRLTSLTIGFASGAGDSIAVLCAQRDRAFAAGRAHLRAEVLEASQQGKFLEQLASALISLYGTRDFA